jgi:hypothetical protein
MSYIVTNTAQSTPANPAGTTSTTLVMAGLAGSITPTSSGIIIIIINGDGFNTTAADGYEIQISYGTGTAPVNGAAVTGTQVGGLLVMTRAQAASVKIPFSANAIVTGLTVGTAYWIDLAFAAVTGGTGTLNDIGLSVIEL